MALALCCAFVCVVHGVSGAFLFLNKYLQQVAFSPTVGVWAGYELKAMHFRVESSCYGVETEVTTPISGPYALTFVLGAPKKSEP